MCVCAYVCMYEYMCVCMHVCVYVCMYVCISMYVCMYVRMYVCMYVCMHEYVMCMSRVIRMFAGHGESIVTSLLASTCCRALSHAETHEDAMVHTFEALHQQTLVPVITEAETKTETSTSTSTSTSTGTGTGTGTDTSTSTNTASHAPMREAGILAIHVERSASHSVIDIIVAQSTPHFAIAHYTPSCDAHPYTHMSRVDDAASIPAYPCLTTVQRVRIPHVQSNVPSSGTSSHGDAAHTDDEKQSSHMPS